MQGLRRNRQDSKSYDYLCKTLEDAEYHDWCRNYNEIKIKKNKAYTNLREKSLQEKSRGEEKQNPPQKFKDYKKVIQKIRFFLS